MGTEAVAFTPIFNRVLIKRKEAEKKIGSIIIPDQTAEKNRPCKGVVVSYGDTVADKVKDMVGKTVVFAQYSGSSLKVDDQEYFICNDEDIWGVENVR